MFLGSTGMIDGDSYSVFRREQAPWLLTFPLVFAESGAVWSIRCIPARASRPGYAHVHPADLAAATLAVPARDYVSRCGPLEDREPGLALRHRSSLRAEQSYFPTVPRRGSLVDVRCHRGIDLLTLAWELAFPVLVWFRRTRPAMLLIGLALHLGMWVTMEVGAFMPTVLIAYMAFLDPWRTEARVRRLFGLRQRSGSHPCIDLTLSWGLSPTTIRVPF